jgi:mRNA interferase MazF
MKQGEIWQICLDPALGAEMRKTRPALIVSADSLGKLPLVVVVPITGWKDHFSEYSWMVRIDPTAQNGLTKVSAADCFQIRSLSIDRLVSRVGSAEPEIIAKAREAIAQVVGEP